MDAPTALHQLALFTADTRFSDLPEAVVARATWVLRDTVGVIIGGFAAPEVQALADYATQRNPGESRLLLTGASIQPEWAALVYGTAGTTLEMDEGHSYAFGHAAIHAVATALACGDAFNPTGEDLLTALVVGYEVAARVGVASKLRHGVHPFGAWGVLGAAAVGAKLKGFDAAQTLQALNIAASYAITPSFETAFQGANVRNTYAGMVNHNGLLAVDFSQLGFVGERGGAATAFGAILGERFDLDAVTRDLGTHYEILRGYFKPYSACRYSHAAIDACLTLRERIPAEQIERVEIDTYAIAATLDDPAPTTPLGARFSIPFIAASVLRKGHALPDAFREEALTDAATRDLARRIAVREDPALTEKLPDVRSTRVTVFGRDGTQHSMQADGSKGDPDQPMSKTDLHEKFDTLTGHALAPEAAAQLWNLLRDLPDLSEARAIVPLSRETIRQQA